MKKISAFAPVHSCVPHGSVIGPTLYTMYTRPLSAIIDSHSIIHNSFADDMQKLMSAPMMKYMIYFTLCSHVYVMSILGQQRKCLNLMTNKRTLVTSNRTKHLHTMPTSIASAMPISSL